MNNIFHISLPCKNIEETIKYYTKELTLNIGRKSKRWFDINLYGNQVTFVQSEHFDIKFPFYALEENAIPSFHFGVVLSNKEWEELYKVINNWSAETIIKRKFFEDQNGEQNSFFIQDPNGYYIEFKTFRNTEEMFIG